MGSSLPRRIPRATLAAVVFWRKTRPEPSADIRRRLSEAVAAQLPEADDATKRIVTAIAGLLGCVAYADREYAAEEAKLVQQELGRIQGLSSAGAQAICNVLRNEIATIAQAGDQHWSREIKELADRDLRYEVLEVLVDLAAADQELTVEETNYLRRLSTALGLAQRDYDAAQARHRDRLSVLS